jgi:hypothetical protein
MSNVSCKRFYAAETMGCVWMPCVLPSTYFTYLGPYIRKATVAKVQSICIAAPLYIFFTTKNNPPDSRSVVAALGGASHFIPKPGTAKSDTFVCNLNTSKPRRQQITRARWRMRPKRGPASHCVLVMASKPGDRKWRGWEELQVCEEVE